MALLRYRGSTEGAGHGAVPNAEQENTRMTAEPQPTDVRAPHESEESRGGSAAPPHVVVLGGGVAGLTAAYELQRRLGPRAQVTLVSESDRFTLGPALLWVPFGRSSGTISFPIAPGLTRRGIRFVQARVDRVEAERRIVCAGDRELPYDYLLIATGPRADGTAIPGVSGQFNATTSIWSETTAVEARHTLERFLDRPGPVVVGAAQGASYLSAAYEFALSLDYALRQRGTRDHATLTFVTPEPSLGHLDVGAPAARSVFARLFAARGITTITGAAIARVDRTGVQLQGGRTVPAAYTMLIPPFTGATGIWQSPGLTDEHGFIPVDAGYRHLRYPQIYAAGLAAQLTVSSPVLARLPKTGYLSTAMAKIAAQNIAAAITGEVGARHTLPRLLDLRLLDGGDSGVLLLAADLLRPVRLALPLPGRVTHVLKALLTRYLLWKLRTGRSNLP